MGADALDPGSTEDVVVAVPAEHLVREEVQVLVDAEAPLLEEPVERDAVGAIRLARQQVLLHCRGETARVLSVLGRDDVVGDEGAIEGDDRVAAARETPRVEPHAVVHGPGDERYGGGEHERSRSLQSRARSACAGERDDREREQHRVAGSHERHQGDPEPREREAGDRRGEHRTDDQESPRANAAANTGSLESSWNMSAYPW